MVFRYNSKYDWVIDNLKGLDFVSKPTTLTAISFRSFYFDNY